MKTFYLHLLVCALVLIGCNDKDPEPVQAGIVSGTFGDVKLKSKSATASLDNSSDEQLTIMAYFDLAGQTAVMNLSVSSNNIYESLEEKQYVIAGQNPPVPEAIMFWFPVENQPAYGSTYQNSSDPAGTVTITKLDRQRKVVSGTFQCTVLRTDELITIKNGVFTEIPY